MQKEKNNQQKKQNNLLSNVSVHALPMTNPGKKSLVKTFYLRN